MNQQRHPILSHKLWAILPAAGSGSRFSKTELKQYQMIQDRTVLEHTVARMNALPLAGYVLAIGEQDNIAKSLPFSNLAKAHFCLGGAERVYSVLNALNYLGSIADDDDWVLVHDAARPCVSVDCLNNLVKAAIETNQAAILAIPVRDTLKKVSDQHILHTVDRAALWQAQTPQMAKLGQLKRAIQQSLRDGFLMTDEASALEHVGESVQIVTGRADNLKITYPDDLQLAKLILSVQAPNSHI
jgi:2-C-methyl-D-erythritol 4-phosphate cytidylyltransferase